MSTGRPTGSPNSVRASSSAWPSGRVRKRTAMSMSESARAVRTCDPNSHAASTPHRPSRFLRIAATASFSSTRQSQQIRLIQAELARQLLEDRQTGVVFRSVGGGLRSDDVAERRGRRGDAVEIESDHSGHEVVVAARTGRRVAQVEIAGVGLEVEEPDAREERGVTRERQTAFNAFGADAGVELTRGRRQVGEVVRACVGQTSVSPVRSGEPWSVAATPPMST
jgi:hypothetical protein